MTPNILFIPPGTNCNKKCKFKPEPKFIKKLQNEFRLDLKLFTAIISFQVKSPVKWENSTFSLDFVEISDCERSWPSAYLFPAHLTHALFLRKTKNAAQSNFRQFCSTIVLIADKHSVLLFFELNWKINCLLRKYWANFALSDVVPLNLFSQIK